MQDVELYAQILGVASPWSVRTGREAAHAETGDGRCDPLSRSTSSGCNFRLDEFEATSFGGVVKDAGAVKPEEVNALNFMLSGQGGRAV